MSTSSYSEQPRSLDAWLSYLEQIHTKEIDMGLERITQVATTLGVLQPAKKVLTIAGTNGKGSSVAMADAILRQAGYSTACFTSPHIVDYRERVVVNGNMLSEQAHCDAFSAVEKARGETSLTYFEFGTLAALWLMKQHKLDVAILEIGLGGRLDAVNIVEPDASIVTSVDIDHVGFLGDNREDIGYEKAGIYRTGKPAICGDPKPPQRLVSHAQALGAQLFCVEQDYRHELDEHTWAFMPCSERGQEYLKPLQQLPVPQLPLANAPGVIAALQMLGLPISDEAMKRGLATAAVPGRFERWPGQPEVILDVAHNPHAAKYLHDKLMQIRRTQSTQGKVLAVCGMLKDKDIKSTLAELTPAISHWYVASLPGPRAACAEELAGVLDSMGQKAQPFMQVAAAYEAALAEAEPNDILVCFGSFVTVAALYEHKGRAFNGR
ncbi:bifunctional tetrahydrofolate synthase/dihydrofolate synthase [Aliidiomarina taiwanensis]|uniref:Dihydrofolate synthase/folylpolyglutamate synthase n=1 Tax=Aliidiomarina taiwanensis TaxID=946228 RepID=A0A432X8T2_9GAMM|nr:bifunctional tetrahydrofolate synthase/dihydrofolate synthase [Aliidiomarina taiwanensis]RUO43813.1 bifunctional tetrahydrofolate synthase/dihydrofolate synthase [Aliidiomarina taiwanensis]